MPKASGYFSKNSGSMGTGANSDFMKPKAGTGKPKSAGIPSQRGDGDPGRGSVKKGLAGDYGSNANVTTGKAKTFC